MSYGISLGTPLEPLKVSHGSFYSLVWGFFYRQAHTTHLTEPNPDTDPDPIWRYHLLPFEGGGP